jgi:hypothetical protein
MHEGAAPVIIDDKSAINFFSGLEEATALLSAGRAQALVAEDERKRTARAERRKARAQSNPLVQAPLAGWRAGGLGGSSFGDTLGRRTGEAARSPHAMLSLPPVRASRRHAPTEEPPVDAMRRSATSPDALGGTLGRGGRMQLGRMAVVETADGVSAASFGARREQHQTHGHRERTRRSRQLAAISPKQPAPDSQNASSVSLPPLL